MRVLLLHPEDTLRRGPWTAQSWDLIVDLGISSIFSETEWSKRLGCPVLRWSSFRRGAADLKVIREMFSIGRGRLLDEEGIDWWDLTSLLIAQNVETAMILRRVAAQISPEAELWATRPSWPVNAVGTLLGHPIQNISGNLLKRVASPAMHYATLFRRFSMREIKQIFLDKYDPGYDWRSRFAGRNEKVEDPVILLPSAYENVSRTAISYAGMLPEQKFLLVATRDSATRVELPPNVQTRELASYYGVDPRAQEIALLLKKWQALRKDLNSVPELDMLSGAGILDSFEAWIRDGLRGRNAWREVLEREPVQSVLCGDDSNIYTRLPVLLAARRRIPTVDFHHGAFDGRYLLKDLPSDVYLAKGEMERDYLLRVCALPEERVVIGASPTHVRPRTEGKSALGTDVLFFSEPYETAGMRGEEVYRELLPPLCRVARETGRKVIIKLHPFESRWQRNRLLQIVLSAEDRKLVSVLDGPLTGDLMSRAWFGITVESTTVMDCQQNGICCFLCGWLMLTPYDYMQQYGRFGAGEILNSAEQIPEIPRRVQEFRPSISSSDISKTVDPAMLRQWLTSESRERAGLRPVS